MAQFLWYDCTFKKQCTVPVTLTYEGWEIKYQNIGRTHTHKHTHTDRQTGWKQYLATPSGGEVTIYIASLYRAFVKEVGRLTIYPLFCIVH